MWFSLDLDGNSSRKLSSCNTHFAFSVDDKGFEALCQRITKSGAKVFKDNTSPGKSLYFLDPDNHKLEIHVGNWKSRINAKKANPGNWKNVEWLV